MEIARKQINYKGIDIYENALKQTFEFEIHSKFVGKLNGNYKNLEECRECIDRFIKYERTYNLTG